VRVALLIWNYGLLYQIKYHKTKNQQHFGPGLFLEPKEFDGLPLIGKSDPLLTFINP
jgi:hypothetical protein